MNGCRERGRGVEESQHALAGAVLERQHHALTRFSGMVADCPDAGVRSEFVVELGEIIVALPGDPVPQPEEQVLAPLGEILDPRRHSLRVQRQAQDVDRLSETGVCDDNRTVAFRAARLACRR
jgi:hypothetical protein